MSTPKPLQDLTKLVSEIENLRTTIQEINFDNSSLKKAFSEAEEIIKSLSVTNEKLEKEILLLKSSSDNPHLKEEITYLRGIVDNFSKAGGPHVGRSEN